MDRHFLKLHQQAKTDRPSDLGSQGYHAVIALHETSLPFDTCVQMHPQFSRGWYELARLKVEDRLEFTKEFWLSKLPYEPHHVQGIESFFASLDGIGIYCTQKRAQDPFEVKFVYSLEHDGGFFVGNLPASSQDLLAAQEDFSGVILPQDYLCFMEIHNGFYKGMEHGLLSLSELYPCKMRLLEKFVEAQQSIPRGKHVDDPTSLFPFYVSEAEKTYQCFTPDWFPQKEMGSVQYALEDCRMSQPDQTHESLCFETFLDWLCFYLERVV